MSNVEGWSDVKFWGFIRSALRKAFQRYPNKYKCQAQAKVGRGIWACAYCGKHVKAKEIAVDHIIPCGSLRCWDDLLPFVQRLFCKITGLQMLCKTCHYTKTMHERGMTDEDIKVAKFKKLTAKEQRAIIHGNNAAERITNYRKTL